MTQIAIKPSLFFSSQTRPVRLQGTTAQPIQSRQTTPLQKNHFAGQVLQVRFGTSVLEQQNIPTLDMSLFTSGTDADKQAFAKALGEGMKTFGFIALKNHGIAPALLDKNYALMKQFFAQSDDDKKKYHRADLATQRGFLPIALELKRMKPGEEKKFPEQKEAWQSGRPESNLNVDALPEFKKENDALFLEMERVGIDLVKALGIYLNDNGYLESVMVDKTTGKAHGSHMMRSIHYPPVPENIQKMFQPGEAILRAGAHEDMNLITLLPQSTNAGLEIIRKDGTWLPIHAQEGHIIVNAGDMLKLITAGTDKEIPSTPHRVVGTTELVKEDRYSIPMFITPKADMPLKNLATGKPVVAFEKDMDESGRYVYERLNRNGLNRKAEDTYEAFKQRMTPFWFGK